MELKVTTVDVAESGVATITLNRPDRGNSWSARMHAEYRWIMAELESDDAVRVAVLTGAGRAFCVGADSKALSGYVGGEGFDTGYRAPPRPPATVCAASSTRTSPGSSACGSR